MRAPVHPIWRDDGYWAASDAAHARALLLRRQAVDAFWARFADALRRWRWSQRGKRSGRVALCD